MTELKGFKFVTTLVIEFKNIENEKYKKVFSNSKAETIINESNNTFKSIYVTYLKKYIGKGSGWIINSFVSHSIKTSKYNPLSGSIYIKLSKKLDQEKVSLNSKYQ